MKQKKSRSRVVAVVKGPLPPGFGLRIPTAASLAASPSVTALTDVRLLGERQMQIEDEIAELQDRLYDAAQRLLRVKTEDLPLAFDAAGIKRLDLPDGTVIAVKSMITANIKEENRSMAHSWLRQNKFGALIKNTIRVAFGKGDDKIAAKLSAFLKKTKIPYERAEAVHPQTLGAFVREQLGAGKGALPASIEVHEVPTATITRPKG